LRVPSLGRSCSLHPLNISSGIQSSTDKWPMLFGLTCGPSGLPGWPLQANVRMADYPLGTTGRRYRALICPRGRLIEIRPCLSTCRSEPAVQLASAC
jgi:hypothetical protein